MLSVEEPLGRTDSRLRIRRGRQKRKSPTLALGRCRSQGAYYSSARGKKFAKSGKYHQRSRRSFATRACDLEGSASFAGWSRIPDQRECSEVGIQSRTT